ncbi:amino acid aminotransferase [Rivihabitans pingtungensis]|jgi:aromatic-amino-acid transaminase|uniref:Putative 8-amino-7-oxononanoate synthase n=1 Tax=Rivihabitans pingtungensis TaxID=1054498 RepID=A0A318KJP4_9NEIS|nr:amino acid aminotransferase [Rivihabitans pingtungensis]MCK6436720.1 aspartate/tyrosine/aromatic aminotransferase [Rivihabitans pingtungensis]PXX76141.1 aromatic-amino-acid transaminase [Rivihabitans pingtungensis]HNX69982.1 amino acid aminotransferase [Rivihabitans pingtungensis]
MFEHVDAYAGDPILTLVETFNKDTRESKVNLGIGLYYDEAGRIPLLESVRQAEAARAAQPAARPYQPMEGAANYRQAVQHLLFGAEHPAVKEGRIATIQTIGGSGAIKIGADLLKRYFPASEVWVSSPTWDNHRSMFEGAGFKVHDYPYYDASTGGVNFAAMLDTLKSLPAKSIVLLHPCCHNPTGVDLNQEQWLQVIAVAKANQLIPFMDIAYQGFGDGLDEDAFAIRAMTEAGVSFLLSNSFSKNLSLYGERCGGLSVICQNAEEANRVLGQMKFTVRRNYSSPPTHGGQVTAAVMNTAELRAIWEGEVAEMRVRIKAMRQKLFEVLTAKVPGRDFSYFVKQRGMFSYTGLTPEQVDRLREEFAVYLVRSGRMCVAGLNTRNVEYVADAMAAVLKG